MAEVSQAPAVPEPKGIAGWLTLPVIGTFLSPLISAYAAFQYAVVLLSSSLPTALVAFIVVEFFFNFGLVVAWTFAAILLFRHKRLYPRLFVALLVIMLIGTVLDFVVTAALFDMKLDSSDVRSAVRSVILLTIWGPYMHKSVRVKNTFVED